jgi:transposase-like protein
MDKTCILVMGEWRYLYRAVDKDGNTIDFLLRAHRDKTAALRYFEKSIAQSGVPETVNIDKSGTNLRALEAINADRKAPIKIRQSKYLNNLVEQDHRAIKRRTRPMLGSKPFRCAQILLAGIELMGYFKSGVGNAAYEACGLKVEKSSLPAIRNSTVRMVLKLAYPRALRLAA